MPPYAGSSDRELSFAIGCRIVESRFSSFVSRDVNCMQSSSAARFIDASSAGCV
jgi:hypothetical protein